MNEILLKEEYFHWMCDIISWDHVPIARYSRLLNFLYNKNFNYIMEKDGNRYEDGVDLRYEFGYENNIPDTIIADELDDCSCSMLEMMVALARKCERIADDPEYGNRTGEWFWMMVSNMGLTKYEDLYFDSRVVDQILERFLNRDYERDGTGGLFIVPNRQDDMRYVEIWYQAMWYLNWYLNERG